MAQKSRIDWIRENEEKLISRKYHKEIDRSYTDTFYDARELQAVHGTYQYEMTMLDYIKNGKTEELKKFLLEYARNEQFNEGTVADDALRQAKNIFIALVAMIGKQAAIPGGMPIEEAYYLIDTYTQQCEACLGIEDIYILQYNMVIDFSERVQRYKYPNELSFLIRSCMNYITFHLNEPIEAADVIKYSGMSRSYLCEQFKKETGYSIKEFINHSKIDEAKSLLAHSSRRIPEIAAYLCFSSQPYFHNVFKKLSGYTPAQYRKLCEKGHG